LSSSVTSWVEGGIIQASAAGFHYYNNNRVQPSLGQRNSLSGDPGRKLSFLSIARFVADSRLNK
jgi:hypothetical protein